MTDTTLSIEIRESDAEALVDLVIVTYTLERMLDFNPGAERAMDAIAAKLTVYPPPVARRVARYLARRADTFLAVEQIVISLHAHGIFHGDDS